MPALSAVLIGLLLGITLGAAEPDPVVVQLQVRIGAGEYTTAVSGVTLRIYQDDSVDLRAQVFEADGSLTPVDVDDPSMLLEIRAADQPGSGVRFADWRHVEVGVYEVDDVVEEPGRYNLLVLPDVDDRSRIPESGTDTVTLVVEFIGTSASGSTSRSLVVTVALVGLVGVLVVVATRGRRRVPKEPTPHDTWWNSP